MAFVDQFERKEFKYYVPVIRMEDLRERLLAHISHDPYCNRYSDKRYPVRSIYLDTHAHLFYYEKLESLKVRKKLRVRTYDSETAKMVAFLEIKRKVGKAVYKERAVIPYFEMNNLFNGEKINLLHPEMHTQQVALNRFVYLTNRLHLEPVVLITYEREAFQGIDDQSLRITFDLNVRSYMTDTLDDLLRETDMRTLTDLYFILEVKFSRQMPLWLRGIIRDFALRLQSISKYCEGIDVWGSAETYQKESA